MPENPDLFPIKQKSDQPIDFTLEPDKEEEQMEQAPVRGSNAALEESPIVAALENEDNDDYTD